MKHRLLSLLLCLCMLLPLPAAAGAGAAADGLILTKSAVYDAQRGRVRITLEAYTTGEITTGAASVPCDIVLVLDESGSMAYDIGTRAVYAGELDPGKTYYCLLNGAGTAQPVTCADGVWSRAGQDARVPVVPRTDAADPSADHVQLYAGVQSRRAAVVSAVNRFLAQLAADNANLPADVTAHRVGIVGFSGEASARAIRPLTTALNALDVSALGTSGGTYVDRGLALADALFDGAPAAVGGTRSRAVLVFTDGDPGTGSWSATATKQCAANAINLTHALKQRTDAGGRGAAVYTVGIFSGADPSDLTGSANQYMNAMSSNYPDAAAACAGGNYSVSLGARAPEAGDYYLSAGNTQALEQVFAKIAGQTGSAAISLDGSAVVQDVLSDAFTLPAGADAADVSVTTQDADYSGGALAWKASTLTGFAPEVTVGGGAVRVTGFDFNRNFVAETGRQEGDVTRPGAFHGRKLVISFEAEAADGFLGGSGVQTNAPGSGVFDRDGSAVGAFSSPTVAVPIPEAALRLETADQTIGLGQTLRLETLVQEPDRLADGAANAGVTLTYTICDGDETVGAYTIPAGARTGAWRWNAGYTADAFADGAVTPQYARKTYRITCAASPRDAGTVAPAAVSANATVTVQSCTLTLQLRGWDPGDAQQAFLVRVQGAGSGCASEIDRTAAILEEGSVTITGLPAGTYTVTPVAGWSWRYALTGGTATLAPGADGTVELAAARVNSRWCSGCSASENMFEAG